MTRKQKSKNPQIHLNQKQITEAVLDYIWKHDLLPEGIVDTHYGIEGDPIMIGLPEYASENGAQVKLTITWLRPKPDNVVKVDFKNK